MLRRLGLITTTTLTTLTAAVPAAAPASVPGAAAKAAIMYVAHRGASAHAPENTIAAFTLASRQHADMIEFDVQETKDHQLIVIHDPTLTRTTDVEKVFPRRAPWRVRDFTLAEIRKLDAGSWFSSRYRGERVPTLRHLLSTMRGRGLGLLLEIKLPRLYPGIEARIARELRRSPSWLRPGRVIVQSFDWKSIRRFHRLMPAVPTGLIGTPKATRLPKLARYANLIIPPYGEVTPRYVRSVHHNHMDVYTWTVNDPHVMRRLISYGVDGVITNKPSTLRADTEAA
ncbi:glycerophosphodiester phosphodiesterase [Sphaerisporangium fuscum]|uniref:glycerophosphodiester phosphodiesterase n=1 Tax=Sphaerisporangium fuscum TaxID=2835868 RepID=UPI002029AD98|nr:glycerophosphodiester phosphodiesterase family protein [Sphaerisporangium fuscum]